MGKWNIFICHASEDKIAIADKLYTQLKLLSSEEIWYDDSSILIGDETDDKVFEGLSKTKYGIIIISKKFFRKLYPHIELGAFILRKYEKRTEIIPLHYGISEKTVKKKSLILGKYKGISIDNNNINYVANVIHERIKNYEKEESEKLKEGKKITGIVKSSFDIEPFNKTKGNYNILVLPFRNPEKNNEISPLGENLVFRLIEKTNFQKLGLEIKYMPSFIDYITYEVAKKAGSDYKADMVIWGNDSKLDGDSSHIIYFHYVNIAEKIYSDKISKEGRTEKFETERLVEIKVGNLQLEIDDIIYWFWGNKFYLNNDYRAPLKIGFSPVNN